MSKNKSRAGIALIIVLVLVLLGIGAYVGYTYVQSDVNGNRNTKTEYNLVIEKDDFAYQIGEKLKFKEKVECIFKKGGKEHKEYISK